MSVSELRITPDKLEGQLVDTHTHCGGVDLSNLYKGRYPSSQDILDLDEKRRRTGVGLQVVFPMPTSLYYDIPSYWKLGLFLPSGFSMHPFQLENRYLLALINYFHLNRMLPFLAFSLQDRVSEQETDIFRLAGEYPVYGLKFHTKVDQKSAKNLDVESSFVDLAEQLNIPITFHTEHKKFSYATDVLNLAARHPDVRFCAAHFGGFSKHFFRELDKYPIDNLYFDTCPLLARCFFLSNNHSPDLLDLDYNNPRFVLKYFADRYPNRVLWGTDSPWTSYCSLVEVPQQISPRFSYRQEVDLIKSSGYQEQMTRNTVRFLFG